MRYVERLYFKWLLHYIRNSTIKEYTILLEFLFNKPFLWFVPNDDNRIFEAKKLREDFYELNDNINLTFDSNFFQKDASMLEIIICLAFRCESLAFINMDKHMTVNQWFWLLLKNANLDRFTNDTLQDELNILILDDKLNIIINRTYEKNGKGGLFPLKKSRKNQTRVELWYQMCHFLNENFNFDRD